MGRLNLIVVKNLFSPDIQDRRNVLGLSKEEQPPGTVTILKAFPGNFIASGANLDEARDSLAATVMAFLDRDPDWYDKQFDLKY